MVLGFAPESGVSTECLVEWSQLVVSAANCPVGVADVPGLLPQSIERKRSRQLHQLFGHRLESCHQGRRFFELAMSCLIFKVRRHAASNGGKRRNHPRKLVSGLAEARCVLVVQGTLNCRQLLRQASPKRLTNLLQDGRVAPASSKEYVRIEEVSGE